jgi:agmatinase
METSRLGPQAIRNQLARMRTYSNEIDEDIFSIIKIVDVGDIEVVFDTVEVLQRVESVATKILEDNKTPIVLGGEHMVAYGAIKAVCNRVKGNVGVIYFDAHLDLDDNLYNNSWYNGCPMRRVLDIGNVKPKNLVCIGPRGFVDFPDHQYRFAKEVGVNVFTMDDVDKEGIVSITEKAIERAKDETDALYLSVDIDVLDPSAAPGTGMPIPGGLTSRELLKAVRLIASLGINGYDVTEATPYNDPANITALSAASVVAEMIGGMAKYRSQ